SRERRHETVTSVPENRVLAFDTTSRNASLPIAHSMPEVIGLFPTPFMKVPGVLGRDLIQGLVDHFSVTADRANNASANLSHTAVLRPSDSPLLVDAAALIMPLLGEFG